MHMYIYFLEMGTTSKDATCVPCNQKNKHLVSVWSDRYSISQCYPRPRAIIMKIWRSCLAMCPLARDHDEQKYVWRVMCTTKGTDTMVRSYWSLFLRLAKQGRDRRPAIVIYPDDSQPKQEESAFSSLSLYNPRMHSYL